MHTKHLNKTEKMYLVNQKPKLHNSLSNIKYLRCQITLDLDQLIIIDEYLYLNGTINEFPKLIFCVLASLIKFIKGL